MKKSISRPLALSLLTITIAGLSLALLAGCPKPPKNSPDFPTSTEQTDPSLTVTVFFTKSRGGKSVTEGVVRPLPQGEKIAPIQFAIERLLEGPTPDERKLGYFSEIPKGTALLSVNKTEENVIVDLSEQFSSGGGSNSIIQRMAEMQNTIISASKNSGATPLKISFLVKGKPLQSLGGEGLEPSGAAGHSIQ